MRLYTRQEHGHLPVEVLERGYRLALADGSHREYPNARRLLLDLHGGRDAGLSFDRYFRCGRHNPQCGHPHLNLGGLRLQAERCRVPLCKPHMTSLGASTGMLGLGTPTEKLELGVDLARRGDEVAKLLYASCGQIIRGYGYEFQEVLQEVYAGLLVRNRGAGAWNPAKSSFGYYVTLVCRCVFSNYHKREQRRRGRERCGSWSYRDGSWSQVDVGETASADRLESQCSAVAECMEDLSEYIADRFDAYKQDATLYQDAELAQQVLPLIYAGKRRAEIAIDLGVSPPAVGRALSYLRKVAHSWVGELVLH